LMLTSFNSQGFKTWGLKAFCHNYDLDIQLEHIMC